MELNEEVEDELTCVSSILFDIITVNRENPDQVQVELQIGPLTASDEEISYVGMLLVLSLGPQYPAMAPNIIIKSPRGLSESDVDIMMQEMKSRCLDMSGCPVIFELVDFCREFLTERNIPHGPCPICLTTIQSSDTFCKTACFHYFHSFCLGKHFQAMDNDQSSVLCPVCREGISAMDAGKLVNAQEPELGPEHDQHVLDAWKATRDKNKALFNKQLAAGGIIDLDQEAKRFLVVTTPENPDPPAAAASTSNNNDQNTVKTEDNPPVKPGQAKTKPVKDEDAGNRQRYKRQPRSKFAHHRQIKSKQS